MHCCILAELFYFFYEKKILTFQSHFIIVELQKIILLLNVRDSATFDEEKSSLCDCSKIKKLSFSQTGF